MSTGNLGNERHRRRDCVQCEQRHATMKRCNDRMNEMARQCEQYRSIIKDLTMMAEENAVSYRTDMDTVISISSLQQENQVFKVLKAFNFNNQPVSIILWCKFYSSLSQNVETPNNYLLFSITQVISKASWEMIYENLYLIILEFLMSICMTFNPKKHTGL